MHGNALRAAALVLGAILAGCSGGAADDDGTVRIGDGIIDTSDAVSAIHGAIAGVVVDEAIRPVAGANVTSPQGPATSTDESGVFLLGNLEPGFYALHVQAPGYLAIQASADVVAGETSQVKVQLLADRSPQPYQVTYYHEGFMQAWAGIGQFVLEILLENGTGLCDCRIHVQPEPAARTFVVEAFWDNSFPDPLNLAEFYMAISEEPDGFLETDYCYSPCRMELDAEGIGYLGGPIEARLDGADAWVSYNQQFKMYFTVFYNADAPEDWSIANA